MTAPHPQSTPPAPNQAHPPPVIPPPVPAPLKRSTPPRRVVRDSARETMRNARAPRKAIRDTITATHGTLAVGGLEHAANVPWGYPAILTAVLAGIGAWWGSEEHSDIGFGATMGAGAGGWLTWAAIETPWDIPQLSTLVVAATGAGAWYAKVRRRSRLARRMRQRVDTRLDHQALDRAEKQDVREAWQAILAEADCRGAQIEQVRALTNGAQGFEIHGRLTSPRFDYKQLETTISSLELIADARTEYPIRPGSIQLKRPANPTAGQWIMTVPTANIFGKPIPHPINHEPRSIEDPIEVATAADGSRISIRHADSPHAMFSGMTDFGKSNFLNCHIFEWTRCTDAVVWLMSGPDKAPKLMKPLLRPWLKGETPNPPVDRIAASKTESMYMLWDAIQGMGYRAGSGGIDDVGSKWDVTPETPRLLIGIEEAGDYLEDEHPVYMPDGKRYTFGDLLRWLIRKARSEAINILLLTQGGTLDFLGSSGSGIRKQILYRAAFRAQTASEMNACLAGDTSRVELGELDKGEIYIEQLGYERPVLALADYMEEGSTPDEHMMNIAAARHYQYAHALDDGTAASMPYYRDRWTRPEQQEYLAALMGVSVETMTSTPSMSENTTTETVETHTESNTDNGESADAAEAYEQRMNAILEQYQQDIDNEIIQNLETSMQDETRGLGDLDPDTLRVVGVIQKITDSEVSADELRSQVAIDLSMDDSTETDRYINAAIKDIVEDVSRVKARRNRGGSKITVWDIEEINRTIKNMGR